MLVKFILASETTKHNSLYWFRQLLHLLPDELQVSAGGAQTLWCRHGLDKVNLPEAVPEVLLLLQVPTWRPSKRTSSWRCLTCLAHVALISFHLEKIENNVFLNLIFTTTALLTWSRFCVCDAQAGAYLRIWMKV